MLEPLFRKLHIWGKTFERDTVEAGTPSRANASSATLSSPWAPSGKPKTNMPRPKLLVRNCSSEINRNCTIRETQNKHATSEAGTPSRANVSSATLSSPWAPPRKPTSGTCALSNSTDVCSSEIKSGAATTHWRTSLDWHLQRSNMRMHIFWSRRRHNPKLYKQLNNWLGLET